MSSIKTIMHIKDKNKVEAYNNNTNEKNANSNHEPEKQQINQIAPTSTNAMPNNPKRIQQGAKASIKEEIIAIPSAKVRKSNPNPKSHPKPIKETNENKDHLLSLWDSLGVTQTYRSLFDIHSNQVPLYIKNSYFSNEIVKMTKIKVHIQKLNKDIATRDKLISLLKKYDDYITLEYSGPNGVNQYPAKRLNDKVINDIKAALRDLRIISINIVNQYKRIRKEIGYDCYCGKYDMEKMTNLNMEYMLNMRSDTGFLSKSALATLFRFSNEEDVFLNMLRRDIPYEEAIGQMIPECQFALIYEVLMDRVRKENKDANGAAAVVMDGNGTEKGEYNDNDNDFEDDELFIKKIEEKIGKKTNSKKDNTKIENSIKEKENVKESLSNIKANDNTKANVTEVKSKEIIQPNNNTKANPNDDLAKQYEEALIKELEEGSSLKKQSKEDKIKQCIVEKNVIIKGKEEITSTALSKPSLPQSDNNNDNNHIHNPYDYEYLFGNISAIQKIYSSFYDKINKDLKIAFNIQSDIQSYLNGSYPHIILIRNSTNKDIQGMAFISYDSNTINGNKLNIHNIFSIDKEAFLNVFQSFISYCKSNLSFDELNIDLYYGYKEDKFYLIKSIEDIIKSKAKFRWVNLINDGNSRKIKYKLPNQSNDDKQKDIPLPKIEAFQIKSCTMIFLKEYKEGDDNNNNNNRDSGSNGNDINENKILILPLTSLLCEMLYNKEYSIDHPLVNYMNLESMKEISQPIAYNLIRTNQQELTEVIDESLPELKQLFNTTDSVFKQRAKEELFLCSSLFNINLAFNTISTTIINSKPYNRISVDKIEAFTFNTENGNTGNDNDKDKEDLFFLLKTKNERISIMIYEHKQGVNNPNHNFNKYFLNESNKTNQDNNQLLSDYFNEVYHDFIPKQSINKKTIYLPPFTIEDSSKYTSSQVFNDLIIKDNQGKSYCVDSLNQISVLSLEKDNNNDGTILYEINEDKEDVVITNDFFIAVIHYDIINEFEIANIAAFIVNNPNKST